MEKIGFRVDETITVKGPFERLANMEVIQAEGGIVSQEQKYCGLVRIDGQEDLCLPGESDRQCRGDSLREEARGLIALGELAKFSPNAHEGFVLLTSIPDLPKGATHWTIEGIRSYVEQQLDGYRIESEGSRWQALKKQRIQCQGM